MSYEKNAVGIDVSNGRSTVSVLRPFGEVVVLPFNVQHTTEELSALADKLLSIDGVLASFAICLVDGAIRISGRSGGKINVQRIMEKLGGGGHFEAAATSMNDVTPEEAADILENAVYEYLSETAEAKKENK